MIQSLLGIGASVVGSKILSTLTAQRISILHAMPGRLRLKCNEWNNADIALSLENNLLQHPYIQEATVSPITGSLLIKFAKPYLSMDELDEILKRAVESTKQSYPSKEAQAMRTLKDTLQLIDGRIKAQTKGILDINAIIIFLLVGKGISNLKRNRAFSASLFFWAYSMVVNQKDKPL